MRWFPHSPRPPQSTGKPAIYSILARSNTVLVRTLVRGPLEVTPTTEEIYQKVCLISNVVESTKDSVDLHVCHCHHSQCLAARLLYIAALILPECVKHQGTWPCWQISNLVVACVRAWRPLQCRTQRVVTRLRSEFRVETILATFELNRVHIEFKSLPRQQR
jgi:hypothetical protein